MTATETIALAASVSYREVSGELFRTAGGPGTGGDERVYTTRVRPTDRDYVAAVHATRPLPPVRDSRHPGYVDVPTWATDLHARMTVNARHGHVVESVDTRSEPGRVLVTMTLGAADFPADTGILTRTLRATPQCDGYVDESGEVRCDRTAVALALFRDSYGGGTSVVATCDDCLLTETPEETVALSELPVRCAACGEPVWLAHAEPHGPCGSGCPAEATHSGHLACRCPYTDYVMFPVADGR